MAGEVSAVHVYDGSQVTVSPEEVLLDPYGFHCAACDLEVGAKLLTYLGDLARSVFLDADPHDYIGDDGPPVDEASS